MVFYAGGAFPARFNGSLIISYHGYRQHGHRFADGVVGRLSYEGTKR